MSELSVREQVTAAICEVFHPGANHDLPQMACTKAGVAADAVLAVVVAELERIAGICDVYATESTWSGYIIASKQIAALVRENAQGVTR